MNKNYWVPTDNGDMQYNTSSRVDPKRPHQWLMDPSEPELSRNKKQAVDAVNGRLVSGYPNMSHAMFGNQSNFQPIQAQYASDLYNSENFRTSNLVDRNISMVGTGGFNMGNKGFEDPYGSNSSMSRIEDPSLCLNYGGPRKVKVNQVRDSENPMHISSGQSYNGVANIDISNGAGYENNGISLGQVFNGGDGSSLSMGTAFNKMDGNFISMGQSYNKGGGNFLLMGHNYSKGNDNNLSMGQPFDKRNDGFMSMVMQQQQQYEKGNCNVQPAGSAYDKDNESFISMSRSCNNINGNFISIGSSYDIGSDNIMSSDSSEKAGRSVVSTVTDCDKGSSCVMGQNGGDGSSISFGGVQDESEINHSGDMVNGCSLTGSQPSTRNPEVAAQEKSTEHAAVPVTSSASARTPKSNATAKSKEPKSAKKLPVNNFPTHVKSLLSTGILDGVPVKYVAWPPEKSNSGIIKGAAYLCGCQDCSFNKAVNAYEFERHAGCKTKHPNSRIYFENGKTIYAVVQELKMTPPDMLFEAIENATGSPINEENFRIWKESFQAASRELQRIYGKDQVISPSSCSEVKKRTMKRMI